MALGRTDAHPDPERAAPLRRDSKAKQQTAEREACQDLLRTLDGAAAERPRGELDR